MSWAGNVANGSRFTWSMNLATASGRNAVNLSWELRGSSRRAERTATRRAGPARSTRSPPHTSRTLASGPIQYLKLTATKQDLTPMPDANSVELNDPGNPTYRYIVQVGLPKPLQVGNYMDDPLLLRMASPSGGQNQAWDCDSRAQLPRRDRDRLSDDVHRELPRRRRRRRRATGTNILCAGWGAAQPPTPPTIGPGPSTVPVRLRHHGDRRQDRAAARRPAPSGFETPCVRQQLAGSIASARLAVSSAT